jgi:uncharacterized protein with HEPN domain
MLSERESGAYHARGAVIEWREMAAAGNFYRHGYEDVTAQRVWKTLKDHLPALRAVIEHELAS